MIRRFPKQFLGLSAVCLVLALPIIGTVIIHVRATQGDIAHLQGEQVGLGASVIADDVLVGVERYRVLLLDEGAGAAAEQARAAAAVTNSLAALHADPWQSVADAGPRTGLAELDSRWQQITVIRSATDRGLATIPLAETLLSLLLDLDDASGLTYDPTVASINLSDALVARLPSQAERRDRSAELLELASRRGRTRPFDIVGAQASAGEARDALAAAIDDLEGAAQAIPDLESALRPDRDRLERSAEALTLAINALSLDGSSARGRAIRELRLTALTASDEILHASERQLSAAFDKRIAAYDEAIRFTLLLGVLALILTFAVVALLWRAMRRRTELELDRANERAEALEATLARRNAERALRMTEQQFRAVFEGAHVGIAIVDRTGRLLEANDVFHTMFDTEIAVIIDVARGMFAELERGDGSAVSAEHRFAMRGQPILWAEVSLSFIRAEADDKVSAIVMVHDITEHKALHARLDYETLHDTLTELPNRLFFMRRLEELVAAPGERFAVVFIDLDRFKSVNDTLGHHAGDRVLRLAAQQLTDTVRSCDFVARLHGDEFALLLADLPDAGQSEIDAITARLELALRLPVDTGADPIIVSGSIGVVRSRDDYHTAEEYLRAADTAMYRSKLKGRGCATFYDPTMDDQETAQARSRAS